jgi:hypothetical protein
MTFKNLEKNRQLIDSKQSKDKFKNKISFIHKKKFKDKA